MPKTKPMEGLVVKVVPEQNLVFGWAYVSIEKDGTPVVDHSGEMIEPEELEMAAYGFNLKFRESGVMHEGEAVGKLVESFVTTKDKLSAMGLEEGSLPVGLWLGFFVEDDAVFEKIKNGEYSMFSIQGTATREEVP